MDAHNSFRLAAFEQWREHQEAATSDLGMAVLAMAGDPDGWLEVAPHMLDNVFKSLLARSGRHDKWATIADMEALRSHARQVEDSLENIRRRAEDEGDTAPRWVTQLSGRLGDLAVRAHERRSEMEKPAWGMPEPHRNHF